MDSSAKELFVADFPKMTTEKNTKSGSDPSVSVKVYIIDPKKFQNRQDVNSSSTNVKLPSSISGSQHKRRVFPTIAKENRSDEDEGDSLLSILGRTSTTTRAGRVTKPSKPVTLLTDLPAPPPPSASRIKKREPPEFFRCQSCQKFYLGNAKLKSHLKKFPTHQASPQYLKTLAPSLRKAPSIVSVGVQSENSIQENNSPEEQSTSKLPEILLPLPPLPTRSFFERNQDPISQGPNFTDIQHFEGSNPSPATPMTHYWSFNSNLSKDEISPGRSSSDLTRKDDLTSEQGTFRPVKTIWDLVEKKLLQNGINQMLLEIGDVAEKLGKIARDKIIPIREDEEERLPTCTPIVRVENPFMSHLLDLPEGTYVFREDGGIRRQPPPPPSTELSLTAGEVDIDKFLACNMEMDLNLPHLTNLDIAAICNN